ncbi:GIY-YIG nuclease family protein [Capilliphycus salinus ALCB114379]|uniref:GIY-YIG nuclease family protein n=1 Tax=Capilliphycus salinus TaxID=2768948 RepID=UPI0039A50B15
MWLKYGADPNGCLKSVDDVGRGKTNLTCLYCGGQLTAKKGPIKSHHFAHTGETCKPVSIRHKTKQFPGLPLYDRFNIQLPGREMEQLKVLWREYGAQDILIPRDLINLRWKFQGLVQWVNDCYQFSDLGKIPMGVLGLSKFNQIQEPLLWETWEKYRRAAERATLANYSNVQEYQADLRIYETLLKRILVNSLYFLEVKADGQTLHKIGITQRTIDERISEIYQDLKSHYSQIQVSLLGLWEHRGNVELYFKHRYREFNYRVGKLTEYFQFPNVKLV